MLLNACDLFQETALNKCKLSSVLQERPTILFVGITT